jgi:hypothetical protein
MSTVSVSAGVGREVSVGAGVGRRAGVKAVIRAGGGRSLGGCVDPRVGSWCWSGRKSWS